MSQRSDPLVPILGSAVALVVIGAVGLVIYPRVSRWFGPERASVAGVRPDPSARVPVWVCRSQKGVALLLEPEFGDRSLDQSVTGGPYSYLRLSVYNFGQDEPFVLDLGTAMEAPDGKPGLFAVATRLKPDLPAYRRTVLRGLGAVARLEVGKGHQGQALMLTAPNPSGRGSFALGPLMFERRELARQALAEWQRKPDLREFMDF